MKRMGMFTVLITTPRRLSTEPGKPMPMDATWLLSIWFSSTRPNAMSVRVSPICSMEEKCRGIFFVAIS